MFDADVTALACVHDVVWAGTADGLFRVHDGRIDYRLNAAGGLPDNAIAALSLSPDGSLWIGSDDGVTRWRDGELSVYRTRDGLSHSVVLSVYVDREGTLWTGTKDGLDQFTDPKLTPYSRSEGLSSNEVGPVLQDRAGLLWIGTLDRGIDIFDGRRFHELTTRDGLLSDRVLALAADSGGDVWAGTDKGLNQIHDGRVVGAWDRNQSVHGLSIDGSSIWIATAQGIDLLANGSVQRKSTTPVSAFVPMSAAAMPVSPALPGVFRPVSSYIRESDGALWMGSLGAGLARWRNGSVARVHVKDGLYDNRIYALLRDDQSNLWMASSKGIFRIAERELNDFADGKLRSVTSVPFSTGQLRFECRSGVQPAACRTRDGRLWFATTTGLVVVDPNHLVANSVPPPARITALIVDGERSGTDDPRIQSWQKNLEIRYAGLSFVSPERVTFRYILDGYEKNWTDAGARREAFYTNLPPGHFRFRVMARNADGVWGREAQALAFTVEPRFYQRKWFWPALAGLLAGMIFLGYRRRVRRMQRTFSLLLAERSRIARELHDTLLQGIAGVTMQLQALWKQMPPGSSKQVLAGIITDAGHCAAEARQSLWQLRAPVTRHAGFGQRISEVCREALAGTAIRLQLAIDPEAAATPEIEYQILRITKEALTNAARHSHADTVKVRLVAREGTLDLSIQDDGCGFTASNDYSVLGHFGLIGMRERAGEIGAELNLTSSSSGTTVCVRVPASSTNKSAKELAYEQSDTNPVR
ncbi:MAG TPA: two-component regulator propeller domain-containing protein [Rhizomicrobium sp.]|nr:two-component regulator propeller domain-containing protein [Rhizomicrobium sp.]